VPNPIYQQAPIPTAYFSPETLERYSQYKKTRAVGFNPIYKRVLWEYAHPTLGTLTVAKGLVTKVNFAIENLFSVSYRFYFIGVS
jgi:hypothetical protein